MDIRRPPRSKSTFWQRKSAKKADATPAVLTLATAGASDAYQSDERREAQKWPTCSATEPPGARRASARPSPQIGASKNVALPPQVPFSQGERAEARRSLRQLFFAPTKDFHKVRLDAAEVQKVLGTEDAAKLRALCGAIEQEVYDEATGSTALVPLAFRCSVLTGDHEFPPMLMGAPRAAGSFGKVRDCLALFDGAKVRGHLVLKELRHKPVRPTREGQAGPEPKSLYNRFGRPRNTMSLPEDAQHEYALSLKLGGAIRCHACLCDGDKSYLAFDPIDCDLFTLLEATTQQSACDVALFVGERYAQHLADIHSKGFVHVDGKIDNVGVRFADGACALLDFGGALPIDSVTLRTEVFPEAITDVAPELLRGQMPGCAHDVWCMGLVLMTCLNLAMPLARFDATDLATKHLLAEPISSYNQAILNDYARWRATLFPSGASEIDVQQLARVQRFEARRNMNHAIIAAPDLAAYIITHLLDPDPRTRHTAQEAERHLAAFSRNKLDVGRLTSVFASVQKRQAQQKAPIERLNAVADFLLEKDALAFVAPSGLIAGP